MPTKTARTSPAKKKQTVPDSSTQQPPNGAVPATRPSPDLPQSVDLIADAVGEMLTKGTTDGCLDRLLVAAITHITRRTYERGIGTVDEKIIREAIDREIGSHYQTWKVDVIASWRNSRRKSQTAIEPATVVERIRTAVREQLQNELEKFLASGSPEELRFLLEVMINYDSLNPAHATAEMHLGQAFDYELGRGDVYFRVPSHLCDQVEKYVQALLAIDREAA